MTTAVPATHRLSPEAAARITKRMAQVSVGVAVVLIGLKTWAWLMSGSVAMLSSLADSTLDFAASLFTYFAVTYAASPPDREHRFGHGKAEAFAGLFQAGLVAVSAALVLVEALHRLFAPQPIVQAEIGIGVMAVSIVLTGGLVYLQTRAIRQTGSLATAGDRTHYLSDFAANAAALVGIAAAAFWGVLWADAAAAVFVVFWLIVGAWDIAKRAGDHLMDREMPDAERERIRELALGEPGIRNVHALRTRMAGPTVHIQFHADLDPDISLDAAHQIVVSAERRIRAEFPAADILIHPDPGARAEPHGLQPFGER